MHMGRGRGEWFVGFLLLWAASAFALTPDRPLPQYQKKYWQTEQNLPGNEVWAMDYASDGHLLVGTGAGLARFDGLRFMLPDIDGPVDLAKEWITAINTTRDGGLWVATHDNGVYQCRDGQAKRYVLRREWGLVRWLFQDSAGTLWASSEKALLRLSGDRFVNIPGMTGSRHWYSIAGNGNGTIWTVGADGLSRIRNGQAMLVLDNRVVGTVLSVARCDDGTLWAGTTRGLFRVPDAHHGRVERQPGLSGLVVGILCDRSGEVWVATWGNGLYRVNGKSVDHWGVREGLPDNFVTMLFEDREGDLWIGMRTGGLGRWKDTFLVPYEPRHLPSGYFASAVTEDPRDGSLLLGTWRSGIFRFQDGRMDPFPMLYNPLWISVRALAMDTRGNTWVGVGPGEIDQYDGRHYRLHHLPGDMGTSQPSAILWDKEHRLWIGTEEKGIVRYGSGEPGVGTAERILPDQHITAMLQDSQRRVWIGTMQGLYCASGDLQPAIRPQLGREYITAVSEDSLGRIWVGGDNGRIWIVFPERVAAIGPDQGVPPVTIFEILDDGVGSYWMSSPAGIIEIRKREIEELLSGRALRVNPLTYTQDDGMRSIECHGLSQPAGWRDRQGRLWFPTVKGFVEVRPSERRTLPPPRSIIEEVFLAGKRLTVRPVIRLAPDSRDLEIRFSALRLGNPQQLSFRYRLEGVDPAWVEPLSGNVAHYSKVAKGPHVFEVAARDRGGVWSGEVARIEIDRVPHIYETSVFRAGLLLCLAAAGATVFRLRFRALRKRYSAVLAERNRIAREWHDTLLAGFSAVGWQLETTSRHLDREPEEALESLQTARRMVQHCQAEARRIIWDLREELTGAESLDDAISRSLVRLTTGSAVKRSLDIAGQPVKLAREIERNVVCIVQEAVFNAIRHGCADEIAVHLQYLDDCLAVRVKDNGVGFDSGRLAENGAGHFGVLGMQERANALGGRFELQSRPGDGTLVEAVFPFSAGG
jgi:signal transduction histidine kinase/ligand-binding sensor domain-containing protein